MTTSQSGRFRIISLINQKHHILPIRILAKTYQKVQYQSQHLKVCDWYVLTKKTALQEKSRYIKGEITMKNPIFFMEKNIRGAWVVYGELGVRQYYYYTKAQAKQMYIDEYKSTIITAK